MFAEAVSEFNDCADMYDGQKYRDVSQNALFAEAIIEAINVGQGGDFRLQKDKSDELTLCLNTGNRITPIAVIDLNGEFKSQVQEIEQIYETIKLPVITDIACDLKPA